MIVAPAHTTAAVNLLTMAPARIVTKTGLEEEGVKDLAVGEAVEAVEAVGGIGGIGGIDTPVVCHSTYFVSRTGFC